METHVVIMAGGVGSRLYPLSTPEKPKQFLDLLDSGKTLIQMTVERFLPVCRPENFWVVTSAGYVHYVREQVPAIPAEHILSEPCSRNTAPCIAYACRKIAFRHPDANVIVTPADAYVPDSNAFCKTMDVALTHTETSDDIVCIGITPDRPATVYGYIHADSLECDHVAKVLSFKEKPDLATAEAYLSAGGFFWNAGIFVWNVRAIETQMRHHAPQISEVMDKIAPALYTEGESEALETIFPSFEKISIDYAVMEKSSDVYVVPAAWEWSDLGSFEALEKFKH